MTQKSSAKKDARLLQKQFGCSYMTALRLRMELGMDGAFNQLQEWKNDSCGAEGRGWKGPV